jgi:GTP cyclohydrolase I
MMNFFPVIKLIVEEILNTRFYDISNFNDIVLLRSINFSSSCEHHMLPFTGFVDIAYLPDGFVVGISKLARLVDAFSKAVTNSGKNDCKYCGSPRYILEAS